MRVRLRHRSTGGDDNDDKGRAHGSRRNRKSSGAGEAEDDDDASDSSAADDDDEDDDEEDEDEGSAGGSRHSSREVTEIRLPSAQEGAAGAGDWWDEGVCSTKSSKRRLEVLLNGRVLPSHITIYQAIQSFGAASQGQDGAAAAGEAGQDDPSPLALLRLGSQSGVEVIRFRRARHVTDSPARPGSRSRTTHSLCRDASTLNVTAQSGGGASILDGSSVSIQPLSAAEMVLPAEVDTSLLREGNILPAMALLRALHSMCTRRGAGVSPMMFVNHRLAAKVTLEVCNFRAVSAGTFPPWCRAVVRACPFLLTFEQRRRFFLYTSFGAARALQHYKAENHLDTGNEDSSRFRLSRTKVRVDRSRLLESTHHILRQFGKSPTVLEVEFRGEVGTGLGPTMEFFALTSREFQRADLGLWLDAETGEHVYARAPGGLYPKPVKEPSQKTLTLFEMLGYFMAKAMEDGRVLDIHLSPAFFMWMAGEYPSSLADLATIDAELAASLEKVEHFARASQAILAQGLDEATVTAKLAEVRVDGATLEDFSLTFELPGQPGYELCEGGSEREVDMRNVAEYYDVG